MAKTSKTYEGLSKIVDDTIVLALSEQLDKYTDLINETRSYFDSHKVSNDIFLENEQESLKKNLTLLLDSKKEVLDLIEKYLPPQDQEDSESRFDPSIRTTNFQNSIEEWLQQFPERNVEFQSKDRFTILESDSKPVKGLKIIKKGFFSVSVLPKKTLNLFRKLFKKKPKQIHFWKHSIPERNLNNWFYNYQFLDKFLPVCENTDKEILEAINSLFNMEELVDHQILKSYLKIEEKKDDIKSEENDVETDNDAKIDKGADINNNNNTGPDIKLESAKDPEVVEKGKDEQREETIQAIPELESSKIKANNKRDAKKIQAEVSENFANARDKVGTFELSYGRFKRKRLAKYDQNIKQKYNKSTKNWNNAHRAVLEDYKLDLVLYCSIYQILILIIDLKSQLNDKIHSLDPFLKDIIVYQQQIKSTGSKKFNDSKELKKFIVESKYDSRKNLRKKKVKELSDLMLNMNFPGILDQFEMSVRRIIYDLPEKSWAVNDEWHTRPVDDSEINYISPSELILFESFGALEKSVRKGKLDILKGSGELKVAIDGISDQVEFSLDTALDYANDELKKDKEVVDLLCENLDRSIARVKDIQAGLMKMEKTFSNLVDDSARTFNSNLYNLTYNDNIYEIKFRYTKARALATTKALRGKFFEKIIEYLARGKKKGKRILELLEPFYKKIMAMYSSTVGVGPISTEVSNFLAEAESRIQQLPYVYQRLFKSEPVTDEAMFIGRESELKSLANAYKKWDQGKYAATILLSEKGGGLTSLINYFTEFQKVKYSITRINPSKRIYEEKEFLIFLGTLLNSSFDNVEQLIHTLNGYPAKRVFILEDLQKFYLRKVGGFECLSILKRIINATNDNIFWVVNTTLYTWDYLHLTTRIGEYFEYKVRLEDLTVEQITDIIANRNKFSGYNVLFEVPEADLKSKKLKQLTDDQIHELYRDKYFDSLNKFTKSNIALSLLYWQLSVLEVTEDTIKIMYFEQPDLSFLSSLDKTKVFILQAIILHDGLTPGELGAVINNTENECLLLLLSLYEDGILLKREDVFILNPLIYRQTVTQLKSQNLLV